MSTEPHLVLTAEMLLAAYERGWFPMTHEDGEMYWHDPDPRAVFDLEKLRPNTRLRRFFKNNGYGTTVNTQFEAVIRACAQRDECWINEEMIQAYIDLHGQRYAFSVETWQLGELIGGVYGVAIGKVFFGESMFSIRPNASKAAFHRLAEHLRKEGYTLFDTQYINDHTRALGAFEVGRDEFRWLLNKALGTQETGRP